MQDDGWWKFLKTHDNVFGKKPTDFHLLFVEFIDLNQVSKQDVFLTSQLIWDEVLWRTVVHFIIVSLQAKENRPNNSFHLVVFCYLFWSEKYVPMSIH